MRIILGILGIVALLTVAYALSNNRKSINLRTVGGAFFMQALFAIFVLYVPFGQKVLSHMASGVQLAINAGNRGVEFVFGPLANGAVGFIFFINVLTVIIFFAALISVLYYLKIMPIIINTIGYGIHKILGTSRTESLSAAGNIFVGQTEAPLLVKPFLNNMTKSELFAVMTGGLASVAGSVLVGYASLGVDIKYLIAASFMSAPGGLLMAKIMIPQTEPTKDKISDLISDQDYVSHQPKNVIEAAADGASSGLSLVLNIAAMLIAFIGLVTLLDLILGGLGGLVGVEKLSFDTILGYFFYPFAVIIGVPIEEALAVGALLGQKMLFNEFVAYLNFTKDIASFSVNTQAIVTFALCGFANISSIGILIGGIGVMSPKQKPVIASLAIKAVLAGTLSNLMSATLAGIILSF